MRTIMRVKFSSFCVFLRRRSKILRLSLQQRTSSTHTSPQHTAEEENEVESERERLSWPFSSGLKLYDTHVPSSFLQRAVLAAGSAVGALVNPQRDDLVAIFGETTGHYALQRIRSKMLEEEDGREILRLKPTINTSTTDFNGLRQLPEGSFGREYARFMDTRTFTPDARQKVKYVDDPELAYVMQRYRELHDFTHTLLAMPTSVYGEIVVKWFEAAQTGLPMCLLGGGVAPIRLPFRVQGELWGVYVPWALRNGFQARMLMSVYLEKYFEEPLEELRRRLHILAPPQGSLITSKQPT